MLPFENFGLPLDEEHAVTLELIPHLGDLGDFPLWPKGFVTPLCVQKFEEVEKTWLVMREAELSEEVEAISAVAQELASEFSVGSDETTSNALCDLLCLIVTLRHLLSGVACGGKAMLFLLPGRVPRGTFW